MIARGSQAQSKEQNDIKDSKILLTEVVALVLKPTKDAKMHQAYIDCFVSLSKTNSQSDNLKLQKFVIFTYRELLKKFLGGRGAPAHALNQQFFQRIFEECNFKLSQGLMKPLLRYLLPNMDSADSNLADSEVSASDFAGEKGTKLQARSNHQRLQAIEIFNSLVKSAQKNSDLLKCLENNTKLISDVLVTVVKTSDTWKVKKVKKTMLALGIYTKLGKTAVLSGQMTGSFQQTYEAGGLQLIKAIEGECEKDS
jgi:hypothetical protein